MAKGLRFEIRLSDVEKSSWEQAAEELDMSLTEWVRMRCDVSGYDVDGLTGAPATAETYASAYKPTVVYEMAEDAPLKRESSHKVGCTCTLCKIKAGVIKEARVKYASVSKSEG